MIRERERSVLSLLEHFMHFFLFYVYYMSYLSRVKHRKCKACSALKKEQIYIRVTASGLSLQVRRENYYALVALNYILTYSNSAERMRNA